MGTISIWHWAIVLGVVGVFAGLAIWAVMSARSGALGAQPVGFGGWLLLLAIGQCLGPILTLAQWAQSFDGYDKVLQLPNGAIAIAGETLLNGGLIAFQIFTAVMLLRKRKNFPKLYAIQWVLLLGLPFADWIMISFVLNVPLRDVVDPDDVRKIATSSAALGLWVWYVFVSVRVRNTFVN